LTFPRLSSLFSTTFNTFRGFGSRVSPQAGLTISAGVTTMLFVLVFAVPRLERARPANTKSAASDQAAAVAADISTAAASSTAAGSAGTMAPTQFRLRLHHLHTGESLDVVYKVGNSYVPAALAELNHFLRDHRTEAQSHYDPREFDVLHALMAKLHDTNGEIDVVCGYRTPWSNNFLRTGGGHETPAQSGVAKNSQHMQAKAIDLRIPGESTRQVRDAALSLHAGGVGYYPRSQFVHVDVGPVRQWTFAGSGDGM
jgi:uncharacterized protein YcbK (DUF882 family)